MESHPMEPLTPAVWMKPSVLATVIAFLLVSTTGGVIDTHFYAIGPGPSSNVLELVKVDGAKTYPSKGRLLLTTASVSQGPLNVWEYLEAKVSPQSEPIHRRFIIPEGVTDEQQDQQNRLDMDESKVSAEIAAFQQLGLPVTELPGGRVLTVAPGGPSDGKLVAGDRIIEVDGASTPTRDAIIAAIRERAVGAKARITVVRGEASVSTDQPDPVMQFDIVTGPSVADPKFPAIGVSLGKAFRLPHRVEIDTASIGGPSGGLVFALSIIDLFTEDDLTGGEVIAVTGTIDSLVEGDATVGAIGGVQEKVRAARAAGAFAFIVPAANEAAAVAAGPGPMRIIPVARLSDAVRALRRLKTGSKV